MNPMPSQLLNNSDPYPAEQVQLNLLITDLEMLREAGWYLNGAGIRPGSEIAKELREFIERALTQAAEELSRA